MKVLTVTAVVLLTIPVQGFGAETPNDEKLSLICPAGGEEWAADSLHYVTWKSNGEGTVGLDYTTDGGQNWKRIAGAVPNNGRFLWKIPRQLSDRCKVRVTANSSGETASIRALFSFVASQQTAGYEWTNVTNKAQFAPRDGAGALTFKDRMWLIGGWNPRDKKFFPRICNNEVWSSQDGALWTLVKPNTFKDKNFDAASDWEGRHVSGYVVYKDKMWIVGGDANQGYHMFDVWNSADGRKWNYVNKKKPVPWGPRALHHTLVYRDKIWIMGGQTNPPFAKVEEKFYRDIWNSVDGVRWNEVAPQEPFWTTRGMIAGSTVFKNRMWILGGGTYDTPKHPVRKFYNDVWSSADGVRWKLHVESAPWVARQFHSVAVFDDRLWVLTGYNKPRGELNDVWHSSDGVNWYEVPQTPWSVRHAVSVFVHDGALWMTGGPTGSGPDVWKLTRTSAARKDK